jgi:hypothetical protein
MVWLGLIGIYGWGLNVWADETWVGTIGNKEVVVCMVENLPTQYFYQKYKNAISLISVAGSNHLQETPFYNSQPIYGYWQISSQTPTQLTGIWQDAKHENSQAINLTFLSKGDSFKPLYYNSDGCKNNSYYNFLTNKLNINIKPQVFKKQTYQVISAENVTGFQLITNHSRAQQAINHYTKQIFDDSFHIQHACARKTSFSLKPIYWSKQWLILHYQSGIFNCLGSSYSEIMDEKITFNYQTGEMIKTYQWLNGWRKEPFFHTEDTLKPLIEVTRRFEPKSNADLVEGCRSEFGNFSPPYLTPKGLAFDMSYAYICRSANNTVILPKKVLKPFLTKAGLVAMDDLN